MTSPEPDAEALFREGTSRSPAAGRDLVRQAADLGHAPANAWLAADEVIQQRDTAAALTWLRRIGPDDAPDGVVIYPQRFHPTFGETFDDGVGDFSPSYLIVSPDVRAACRVLDRAGVRLSRVTESGAELGIDDPDTGDEYTPNYVSSPRYAPDGASILTDTKGEISREAADTMLAVVVDEMSKAGIVGVLAVPVDGLLCPAGENGEMPWLVDPHVTATDRADWVFVRTLAGEPGFTREYLASDGGWTGDLSAASRRRGHVGRVVRCRPRVRLGRAARHTGGRSAADVDAGAAAGDVTLSRRPRPSPACG